MRMLGDSSGGGVDGPSAADRPAAGH